MNLYQQFQRLRAFLSAPGRVHAHCDIPCGIYDPHAAQIAALTVIRMNQLIAELPKPGPNAGAKEIEIYNHKLARYTHIKDTHAELCKHEVRILWGDYFKPEHAAQHPELHPMVWDIMKLGSKARQEVDLKLAEDLLAKVQQVAEIFWKTKGIKTKKQPSNQTAKGELVYPSV